MSRLEDEKTGLKMSDQATVAAPSDKPWLFQRGNSAYAQRRQRIEARAEELAREYDVARHTRLGLKVLASLRRKPEPPPPTLQEMLAAADEAANG
jgi:hypothetical protein